MTAPSGKKTGWRGSELHGGLVAPLNTFEGKIKSVCFFLFVCLFVVLGLNLAYTWSHSTSPFL
jgi:hypothetical protein